MTTFKAAGSILRWGLYLALPLAFILGSVRVLLTSAYVRAAYRAPGFPDDSYGFTFQEREDLAILALDYLLNDESIEFLADQTFPDGDALYNARELRHMVDVKELTRSFMVVWIASMGIGALAAVGLWRQAGWPAVGAALARGGKITLGVVVGAALILAVSFSFLFVGFHRLFFQGDSWLFLYSDTLIRLFPVRFWQQVAGALVLLTAVWSGVAIWLGGWLSGRASVVGESS